jgi:hypothetical protein
VAMGLAGLIGVGTTCAAAEPIVERLYNRLIDPGIGLSVVQAGHVALATGGLWQLMIGQRKKAIPYRDRPLRSSRG